LDVWDASLEVIRCSPAWFGAGLDTSPTLINSVLVNVIAPPHNDFLRATLEMGVLGLLSFVLVNLSLLLFGWRTYRQPQLHLQVMGLTMLAVAAGGMVISLSDNYLSFVSVQWYNWTLVGLITASVYASARRWQPGE
jgi:O-antigen ligase